MVRTLREARFPTLLVGDIGVGKTSLVQSILLSTSGIQLVTTGAGAAAGDKSETAGSAANPGVAASSAGNAGATTVVAVTSRLASIVNMSAQTTVERLQGILESKMEKRTKNVYVPLGGKVLDLFIDDLNLPRRDAFGCQPPLELLKHWLDYGGVYDVGRQRSFKLLSDVVLLCAMGRPGGGRQALSARFQSRFSVIHMSFPSEASLQRIFSTILTQKLQDFEEDVKPLGDVVTRATIDIYRAVVARLLPTPAKMHYLFNLRDISRVFQGLLRAHRDYFDSREAVSKLWLHELYRTFHDRLADGADRDWFYRLMDDRVAAHLPGCTLKGLCGGDRRIPPPFADFMSTNRSQV